MPYLRPHWLRPELTKKHSLSFMPAVSSGPGCAEVRGIATETLPTGASIPSRPEDRKTQGSCRRKARWGWSFWDVTVCLFWGSHQAVLHVSDDPRCSSLGRGLPGACVLSTCTRSSGKRGMKRGGAGPREAPPHGFLPLGSGLPHITSFERSQVCQTGGKAGHLQRGCGGTDGRPGLEPDQHGFQSISASRCVALQKSLLLPEPQIPCSMGIKWLIPHEVLL